MSTPTPPPTPKAVPSASGAASGASAASKSAAPTSKQTAAASSGGNSTPPQFARPVSGQPATPAASGTQAPTGAPGSKPQPGIGNQPQSSKDLARNNTAGRQPSSADKPAGAATKQGAGSTAKDVARQGAEQSARMAVDKAGGAGTSKDLEALYGKREDGTQADKTDKAVAATKVAARAVAASAGAGEATGEVIDRVGDTVNKGVHAGQDKARDFGRAVSGKQMLEAAQGAEATANSKKKRGDTPTLAGNKPAGQKNVSGKSTPPAQNGQAEGTTKASGNGPAKKALTAAALVVALVIGGFVALTSGGFVPEQGQPGTPSDEKTVEYTGEAWQQLMQWAVKSTTWDDPPTQIPWTLMAGIAAEQTMFGRYSPYDAIDRDPDSDLKPITATGVNNNTPGLNETATATANLREFVNVYAEAFIEVGRAENLPWDALLAQAAHESGLGKSGLTQMANNFFGIKFNSSCGPDFVMMDTWEVLNGQNVKVPAKWCAWSTPAKGLAGYVKFVKTMPRYSQAIAQHTDGVAYIQELKNAGYATDPSYVSKLTGSILQVRGALKEMGLPIPGDGGGVSASLTEDMVTEEWADATPTLEEDSVAGLAFDESSAVRGSDVSAMGCEIPSPDPAIGGEPGQGVGPFLLTEAAAEEAASVGYDPQSPCVAKWIVSELKQGLKATKDLDTSVWNMEAPYDPEDPEAMTAFNQDMAYWNNVIQLSGLFVSKGNTDEACVLPGQTDLEPGKKANKQYTTQIAYSFHCALGQKPSIFTVQTATWTTPPADATDKEIAEFVPEPKFVTVPLRSSAELMIIEEAFRISYYTTKWDLTSCNAELETAQGLIPLTKDEAEAGGISPSDRCDPGKSAAAAAKLFAAGEAVPVEDRSTDDGPFQPALGGWDNISIALGAVDRDLFVQFASGTSPVVSDSCHADITEFIKDLAEYDQSSDNKNKGQFAQWNNASTVTVQEQIARVKAGRKEITDAGLRGPHLNSRCAPAADSDYGELIGEIAVDLAHSESKYAMKKSYNGISNWAGWLAAKNQGAYVVGKASLVEPRLAATNYTYPELPVNAPKLAKNILAESGRQTGFAGLGQRASEYAVFFGGIAQPFETAGLLVGSLKESSVESTGYFSGVGQTEVDSADCPAELPAGVPAESMDAGSREIGLAELCKRSVEQARTPEAAQAVKWAMNRVGIWWYSQPNRMQEGWADCSSLVSRAYQEGAGLKLFQGNAWTTVTFRTTTPGRPTAPMSELQPGDWFEPTTGHVVMVLADGYIVHASRPGLPIKVQRFYQGSFNLGGYINPDMYR